ncbi:MAG: 1-acyl-sn-glycerol-3-phosphate acyltransferase, partial [Proteobacteria bacterium]|nr:1-acyl-sn-glycerol-3-phosphate acyltransferase [Pseudomonadota bacterium]
MGLLKSILLAGGLVFFGLFGFVFSVIALLLSPVFPELRFRANDVFLIPFSHFSRFVTGVKLTVMNGERIHASRPAILVGNHQSGLDLAFISQACPHKSVIVGKREIAYIPVFGWFFAIAGNLLINRSDKAGSKARIDAIREKLGKHSLNLAIFPEGTRSKTGGILPFKRGAFYLAVSTGYPLIPVVCSSLKGKAVWETSDLKGGNVVVSVLPPIETKGLNLSDLADFSDRVRGMMIEEFDRVT